jgi:hypothetical protein
VLTLGVTTCTITSLVLLPAILTLVRLKGGSGVDDEVEETADEVDEAPAADVGYRAVA